jgi:very-long-chain enoyl-CoA reductase
MVTVVISKGSKPAKNVPVEGVTVGEVRRNYARAHNVDVHRVALKDASVKDKKNPNLKDDVKVAEHTKLLLKDLGMQVPYKLVFLVEYLGPLALVLLWSTRPAFLYPAEVQHQLQEVFHPVAKLAILCWTLHFLKREFESFFVHKFSHATMPVKQLFVNCTYYWSFGAVIGYPLAHPGFKDVVPSDTYVHVGIALFVLCEVGASRTSSSCHLYKKTLTLTLSLYSDTFSITDRWATSSATSCCRTCVPLAPRSGESLAASSSSTPSAPTTHVRCLLGSGFHS